MHVRISHSPSDQQQDSNFPIGDVIAAEYNGQPGYIDGHVQDDGGCVGLYLNSDSGPNGANCVLNACYESGPARDVHFAKAYIYTDYQFIRDQCRSEGAGGRTYPPLNEGYDYLGVSNNPNYNPSVKAKREHARDLMTRQQSGVRPCWPKICIQTLTRTSQDNGYVLYSKSTNINKPGARFAVTGRLPAGSMYTTTETSSSTTGISASVDVGVDLFEVFTASVGLSVSQDYTVSSASGVSVNVDCADGQDGIVVSYDRRSETVSCFC